MRRDEVLELLIEQCKMMGIDYETDGAENPSLSLAARICFEWMRIQRQLSAAEGLAEAVEYNLELLRKADTYPIESAFRPTKENWVAATDSVKQALAAWRAGDE